MNSCFVMRTIRPKSVEETETPGFSLASASEAILSLGMKPQ